MNQWTTSKLCDVGNLILGGLLFLSPWLFHYPGGIESQNAWVSGIVIAVLSIAALAAFAEWEEWLNLIVGLWLVVSPWVLKFSGTTAMRVNLALGVIVAILAAVELASMYRTSWRRTANR